MRLVTRQGANSQALALVSDWGSKRGQCICNVKYEGYMH